MTKPSESNQNVTLTSEQYAALLEKLSELEEAATKKEPTQKKKQPPSDEIDDLLDEGQARSRPASRKTNQAPPDFDSMTNSQLVEAMSQHMRSIFEPFFVEVETLRLHNEIRNMKEDGYDLSEDNLGKVLNKMKGRANLTMQEAYHDVIGKPQPAKEKDPSEKETDDTDETGKKPESENKKTQKSDAAPATKERRDVLRHLPPVPGEKPGAPSGSLDDREPTTLDEAVSRAIEDVAANLE